VLGHNPLSELPLSTVTTAAAPAVDKVCSFIKTSPQQCTAAGMAGYGLIFIASAIISSFTPPVNAAEYHYGTHQAVTLDSGIRGSSTFKYFHPAIVAAVQTGVEVLTTPQRIDTLQAQVFTTWTTPQPFDALQGSIYRTLIQQFIAPPKRPYITTQAEWPRLAPSSFKITTPYLPSAPPVVSYPPVNPRYQYGTHQLHQLQSNNRISFVIPWQIQLYEPYFISLDTIGERDEDYSLRPSSVFHQRPAEGAPYVPPSDRPVTIQTLPQQYANDQGSVYRRQLNALAATLAARDWSNYTLPQTFQVRNDSKVFYQPPTSVQPSRRYWLNGTLPQSQQLYELNRSKVSSRNAANLPNIPIANVYVDLVGIEVNIYQGTLRPEVKKHVGRIVTEPKLIGAIAQLTPPFDFSLSLDAGETLLTARVTSTVYTGVDPTPSAIRSGSPVIDGNRVEQVMRGGVEGCVYDLLCTVTTSLGQTLQQATYFYIEPNLP
jgi:hypothetical protein